MTQRRENYIPAAPEEVEGKYSQSDLLSFASRKPHAQFYKSSPQQQGAEKKGPLQVADRSHERVSKRRACCQKAERHQDGLKGSNAIFSVLLLLIALHQKEILN